MLKNKAFRILLYILIPVIVLVVLYKIFGVADLRTEVAKTAINEDKAKTLIKEMGTAHGIENWDGVKTYQMAFEDEFFGTIGSMSHPYAESKVSFDLNYITDSFDGRLDFTSGAMKGQSWGIQAWETYLKKGDGILNFKDDKNIEFWVPTYQYFIEFPMRIQKANSFNYAGEKEVEGIACEGVMASWNTTEPQSGIDHYLIWIDKDAKRIVKIEYTIREMYRFLTGTASFKNYKEYEGLLLPGNMPVESNIVPVGLLHEMRIKDFKPNVVRLESLRPDASLPVLGDSKE
jgi:hypothetical protein